MVAPKLRFKGFSGDWKQTNLKNIISTLDAGVSVNSEDIQPTSLEASILKTSCITSGIFDKNERKRVLDNNEISRLKEPLLDDSILISRMNTPLLVGMNAYIKYAPQNTYLPDRLWQIKLNKNITNTRWLAFNLGSDKGFQKLKDLATGTSNSMKNISKKDVLNIEIFVPCIIEQTKIANFLTQVDQKIEQLTQKHELLIQYKKGMIQKLFSQQIRFKADDGSEFGESENKELQNISTIVMGSSPKSEYYNNQKIGLPLLQGNADIKNRKSKPRIYTSSITKKCQKNDILLSVRAPVGFVALAEHHACIGRGLCSIQAKKNVSQIFIYQYLLFIEDSWTKFSQGSTFDSINSEQLKKVQINLPTLPEQTKIANFLSSIDQKIDLTHQQLQQAKQWKKGLLQHMFI